MKHPAVAYLPCEDCQARLYDMATGEPKTYKVGPEREIRYYEAAGGHKAPCRTGWKCPKGTPETASENTLNERNHRVLAIFEHARATGFQFVPTFDALLADNFRIIDRSFRAHERGEQAELATMGLMKILPKLVK